MSGSSVTAHRSKMLLSRRSAQPSHSFFPHAAPPCSGLTHCPVKAESTVPSPVGVAAACAGRLSLHPYPSSVFFSASSVLKRVCTLPARPLLLSADASRDMKGFCTLPCPRRDTLHARYGKCEAMVRMADGPVTGLPPQHSSGAWGTPVGIRKRTGQWILSTMVGCFGSDAEVYR